MCFSVYLGKPEPHPFTFRPTGILLHFFLPLIPEVRKVRPIVMELLNFGAEQIIVEVR